MEAVGSALALSPARRREEQVEREPRFPLLRPLAVVSSPIHALSVRADSRLIRRCFFSSIASYATEFVSK